MAPAAGWLVLCSAADASALWVYERLRARGRAPVGLLYAEELAHSGVRWEQRIGAGGATLTLRTSDGRVLRGSAIGGVLNRLTTPPLVVADAAQDGDRDYARSELAAFAASWLRSLGASVVNAPDPHGLCGRWRRPLEWRVLAGRAGFDCAPLRLASEGTDVPRPWTGVADQTTSTMLLSLDGRLPHPGVPDGVQAAAARLHRSSATRVLGLCFDGADPARAGWRFLEATPYPDLTLAGEAGVAALERVLAG